MRRTRWILGLAALVAVLVFVTTVGDGPPGKRGPKPDPPAPAGDEPPPLPDVPSDAAEEEESAVVLTGRVVREGSREPVAGAAVGIERGEEEEARTSTDRDGRFRIAVPPVACEPSDEEPCVLVARAPGAAPLRAVPPGSGSLVSRDVGDLVLRSSWTVRGTVRSEDGSPIGGAKIRFSAAEPPKEAESLAGTWSEVGTYRFTESDANGHFALENVSAGTLLLRVVAPGHVTGWFGGATQSGGPRLDLRLRRGHSARIRVLDSSGEPAAGARVNLYPGYRFRFAGHYRYRHNLDRSATTDAEGRCVLTGLDERNYRVTAELPGWRGSRNPLDPLPPPGSPLDREPAPAEPPRGGAADSGLLAGGTETLLTLSPGWRSYRNSYEDGPGDDHAGPPWWNSPFAWVHSGPPRPARKAAEREEKPPSPDPEPEPAPKEERKPPPDTAWLRFRVMSADGVPIPRVHVRLRGPRDEAEITEPDGTESFSLPPGTYRFRVSPLDFGTTAGDVRGTIELPGGEVTRTEFVMPMIWSVPVEVKGPEGELIPRVRLIVLRGKEDKQVWTGDDGRALLFAERGEPCSLLARPEGLPAVHRPIVPVPPDGPVVLRVPHPGEITGKVLDPAGQPLFGVRVVARREGLDELEQVRWRSGTDDGGRFRIRGPAEGVWRVTAEHAAFSEVSASADTANPAPLTLRLRPLVRLHGRLVDGSGEGVSGVRVEVWRNLGGWLKSDEDGRFEIILPTRHEEMGILLEHDDFLPGKVRVPPAPEGEMEIRLSRGVELTLRVRGSNGSRFSVSFEDEATGNRVYAGKGARKEAEGEVECHWPHAPAGSIRVRISAGKRRERVLTYEAGEGEEVILETELP